MMMKRYFLERPRQVMLWVCIMASISLAHEAKGQRYLEEAIPYRNTALLRTADGLIEVTFTQRDYIGRATPQLTYHSYYRDSIYHTQGGYHGHPLHGIYVERYANRSPKVLGRYAYGLRTGKWQHWDGNGVLRKVSRWKEGQETGAFALYNQSGKPQQRGYLRDGKFDGIVITSHSGDSVNREKKRYRKGEEVAMDEGSWLGRMYDRWRVWFQ
ncbi:toxin-antitoxin system YwqK family antitoxin [Parapedobacter sp. DT-150]|uniref:toxin-antitoxin system YwqK family antitoxin n=1 Tax=Parapedobacter sp. DT-150 TaxID=3396162 RepID=UPI003F1CCCCE